MPLLDHFQRRMKVIEQGHWLSSKKRRVKVRWLILTQNSFRWKNQPRGTRQTSANIDCCRSSIMAAIISHRAGPTIRRFLMPGINCGSLSKARMVLVLVTLLSGLGFMVTDADKTDQ